MLVSNSCGALVVLFKTPAGTVEGKEEQLAYEDPVDEVTISKPFYLDIDDLSEAVFDLYSL